MERCSRHLRVDGDSSRVISEIADVRDQALPLEASKVRAYPRPGVLNMETYGTVSSYDLSFGQGAIENKNSTY